MAKSLTFYKPEQFDPDKGVDIVCKEGLFAVFIEPSKKIHFGVLLDGFTLTQSELQSTYEELKSYFSDTSKLRLKMVGQDYMLKHFHKSDLFNRFPLDKEIVRNHGFEILFYPHIGKVMVSKEDQNEVKIGFKEKIRVLIVDDSEVIRNLLTNVLQKDPSIEVVGQAERPSQVESLIQSQKPDVVTLDIHMPEMDGVTLLKKLIVKYPLPYVMVSSISLEEGPLVLDALDSGAVDYIQKPSFKELGELGPMIIERLRAAASAKVQVRAQKMLKKVSISSINTKKFIIAIGSSTGGTEALKSVLTRLPERIPPILITQHIPPVFSKSFADRLNELCPFEVKEAMDGDLILENRVLIAPGNTQMSVKAGGMNVHVDPQAAPVNRHKPSVDYLFDSVAKEIGKKAVGIILTGMGNDGARGMLSMKRSGAKTIAQNKESCVVFGMPREAIALGAAEEILSLDEIPDKLMEWLTINLAA